MLHKNAVIEVIYLIDMVSFLLIIYSQTLQKIFNGRKIKG